MNKPSRPRVVSNPASRLSDLRGGLRLVVDGTRHITGLVEALHGQIQRVAPPLRRRVLAPAAPATALDADGLLRSRGLARLVYRSIQATTGLVGTGLDGLLARFDAAGPGGPNPQPGPNTPRRDAFVSALNGVLGDHLQRSGNPLTIGFELRQRGQPLQPATLGAAAPRRLLLVHGLCMGDGGWLRDGHDHGALLGTALGAAMVHAR